MKRFCRLRKGFTLVEMILYVAISSLMLFSLSLLLTFLLSSRIKNQSISDVNQQGIQVMQLVTQTVRNAKSIDSPTIGATSNSLSVTMFDPLRSPTVFSVVNGVMQITEGSGNSIPLTNSHVLVSSSSFQNISGASSTDRIIKLLFTISYKNQSGRNENSFVKSFTGSATLRQ